jgi:DNA-binding NarL/FixJ family response regulator
MSTDNERERDEEAARLPDQLGEERLAAPIRRTGMFGTLRRHFIEAVEQALSPPRSQALVAEGRTMPKDRWLPYALGEAELAQHTNPLTPRETEIAEMVAEGMRNREIAAKLVISQRTVETHVNHILRKLDLRSRTQIVAWLTTHSLERPADPATDARPAASTRSTSGTA